MSSTAQTFENAVGTLFYDALSGRDNLIALVGYYASTQGFTAQQCVTGAATQKYGAMSLHDLKLCILEALDNGQ